MSVDKETTPSYVSILLTKDEEFFKKAEELAEEEGLNEEGKKNLLFNSVHGNLAIEEYYYDDKENELYITGELTPTNGEIFYTISIPLSDAVLIDILSHSIKRFNKLKTALEAIQ